MDLLENFKKRASENKKTIVLPEGTEPRVVRAAASILKEGIADLYLLGEEEEIKSIAREVGVSIDGAMLINPAHSDLLDEFAELFFQLRKHKGITEEEARRQVVNPLYFGTMLVHTERAVGMVAGSIN